MQVSVHGDREDCDQLKRKNGSNDTSTNISIGFDVGSHLGLYFAIRNLHDSVALLLLDPICASRDRLCL